MSTNVRSIKCSNQNCSHREERSFWTAMEVLRSLQYLPARHATPTAYSRLSSWQNPWLPPPPRSEERSPTHSGPTFTQWENPGTNNLQSMMGSNTSCGLYRSHHLPGTPMPHPYPRTFITYNEGAIMIGKNVEYLYEEISKMLLLGLGFGRRWWYGWTLDGVCAGLYDWIRSRDFCLLAAHDVCITRINQKRDFTTSFDIRKRLWGRMTVRTWDAETARTHRG